MEKQMKNRCVQASRQLERMRRLYSEIGEPLPVDVMLDLHRHLGSALELAEQNQKMRCREPKQSCRCPS